MPNPLSWHAHHLPSWCHRAGVVVNHVVELAVPFLYFAPQPVAGIAGLVTIGFQAWLMLTGNFSFLNALTAVMAIPTLSDPFLAWLSPVAAPAVAPVGLPLWVLVGAVTVLVAALSYYPVRNMVSSTQVMNTAFDPLHLVNTYGAFGSITKSRYEVVVEGTDEEVVDADTDWETYEFEGKPTDPERRPPQWAPYHLRLDWQMWFAAMTSPRRHPWFFHLLGKLLVADSATLDLLREDPFDGQRPTHVRAELYRYEFTDPAERAETGRWWDRERIDGYFGPVSLSDRRFRRLLERRGWTEVLDAAGSGAESRSEADTTAGSGDRPAPRTDEGGDSGE